MARILVAKEQQTISEMGCAILKITTRDAISMAVTAANTHARIAHILSAAIRDMTVEIQQQVLVSTPNLPVKEKATLIACSTC